MAEEARKGRLEGKNAIVTGAAGYAVIRKQKDNENHEEEDDAFTVTKMVNRR